VKFFKQAFHIFMQLRLSVKIALFFAVMGLFFLSAVEVTGTTEFCNSCHIMNDYYSSWQTSPHAEVNCLLCHLQPGFTGYVKGKINGLAQAVDCAVGRVGTKPNASIMDMSCLRDGCHSVEALEQDVLDVNGVTFRHAKHIMKTVDGITLQCGTCHSHFEGTDHFTVNKEVCYTCHFLEGSQGQGRVVETDCRSCHEVPKEIIKRGMVTINHAEFVSYNASCEQSCHKNEIRQAGRVDDTVCLDCHSFRQETPVDSETLHAAHDQGNEKVECFACHGEITHAQTSVSSVSAMMDCRSCHSDTHQVQQSLYATAHPLHPESQDRVLSPMFMTHVECTGCHIDRTAKTSSVLDSFGTVARAVPRACDVCHVEGTGQQFIPFWQNQIKTVHARISKQLVQQERQLELTPRFEQTDAMRKRVQDAREILDSVAADGSWGVHNFKYTERLLLDAESALSGSED